MTEVEDIQRAGGGEAQRLATGARARDGRQPPSRATTVALLARSRVRRIEEKVAANEADDGTELRASERCDGVEDARRASRL